MYVRFYKTLEKSLVMNLMASHIFENHYSKLLNLSGSRYFHSELLQLDSGDIPVKAER